MLSDESGEAPSLPPLSPALPAVPGVPWIVAASPRPLYSQGISPVCPPMALPLQIICLCVLISPLHQETNRTGHIFVILSCLPLWRPYSQTKSHSEVLRLRL